MEEPVFSVEAGRSQNMKRNEREKKPTFYWFLMFIAWYTLYSKRCVTQMCHLTRRRKLMRPSISNSKQPY